MIDKLLKVTNLTVGEKIIAGARDFKSSIDDPVWYFIKHRPAHIKPFTVGIIDPDEHEFRPIYSCDDYEAAFDRLHFATKGEADG